MAQNKFAKPRIKRHSGQELATIQPAHPPDQISAELTASSPEEPFEEHSLPFPIVGMGASAGGLEAYTDLLKNLPSDTGMAFVLIPHLAASQKSHLVEILAHHTAMPVSTIIHGTVPERNHVYILPPNSFATISQGILNLELRPETGRGPLAIDHFFRSLAVDQKDFAIGVVLSGMDGDGAAGLKAIKGEGGISLVQDPKSALYSSMPLSSIAADHVDLIVPPAEIATELARLGRQFNLSELHPLENGVLPSADEKHLQMLFAMLRGIAGVDFAQYKPGTIRRRIGRRLLVTKVPTLADYVRYVQTHPEEVRLLHEDVLIGVTRFFRDPDLFETLRKTVFPALFEGRPANQQARIWVAGCSTGEEVYSIAMCLLEYLSDVPVEPPIQIFGTDASDGAIERARAGIYSEALLTEIGPARLRKYFVKIDKGYQVSKRVRDLCIFARQNLCSDPPFSRLDLISCRNVMIYLAQSIQKQLIPTFHYALRPGGFLVLGSSETVREFPDLFSTFDRANRIYGKIPAAAVNLDFPRHMTIPLLPEHPVSHPVSQLRETDGWSETELQRAADRIVLARYAPPGLVVNDELKILQSRGHMAPYLDLSAGTPSFHLIRMLRDSIAIPVRDAVTRAIGQDIPVRVEKLTVLDGNATRDVALEILPIPGVSGRGRCYLVLFPPARQALFNGLASLLPPASATGDDKDILIEQLRHDLNATRLYLQSLIEERDARNQELTSYNEEVQSANEELQSINEELETTKEELQSANEELQTVNEELQQRNGVLTQATNDLSNLLSSVNIPVLMLNNDLRIRQFTPLTQKLLNVRPGDIGRPITDIRLNLDANVEDLEPALREVLDTLGTKELEVQDCEGRWQLLRMRPYRTSDNRIEGVVLVMVDIDQLRRSQKELREARDLAQTVIESAQVPLVVLYLDLRIRIVNSAFRAVSGVSRQELEGRSFPELLSMMWGIENTRERLEKLRDQGPGSTFNAELEAKGTQRKTISINARIVQSDGYVVILLTIEDITARREAERLLARENLRLAGQIQSTSLELGRTQEEMRALTGRLFTTQEEERRRVARELHDDINQKVAMLEVDITLAHQHLRENPDEAERILTALRTETTDLAEDLRRISHQLHPSMLEDLGLAFALKNLVEEFAEREEMLANFMERDLPDSIPREIAGTLYRITQEALRNVVKHAGRTHVKVTLEGVDGGLRLEIADLGEGFDPGKRREGLGLLSMSERAHLIQGEFSVRSAAGKGTTVRVDVPASPIPAITAQNLAIPVLADART